MKEYILDLDRPRKLKYGIKGSCLLMQKLAEHKDDLVKIVSITDIASFVKENDPAFWGIINELPYLTWAGLIWEDKEITVDQVEKLLDDQLENKYSFVDIITIVMEAIGTQIAGLKKKVTGTGNKTESEATTINTENLPSASESETEPNLNS